MSEKEYAYVRNAKVDAEDKVRRVIERSSKTPMGQRDPFIQAFLGFIAACETEDIYLKGVTFGYPKPKPVSTGQFGELFGIKLRVEEM